MLQSRSSSVFALPGTVVLLTGAAGAIGSATARRFAAAGATLALSDRDADALVPLAAELTARGTRVEVVAADLLDDAELAKLPARVEDVLGPVDVLVSCAGTEFNAWFDRADPEAIDRQLGIHLRSPMLLVRAVLPGMLSRGRGHIAVVSSQNGALPFPCKVPYCAAKAGSIAMAHALRRELEDTPVGVTAVQPGMVSGEGQGARAMQASGVEAPSSLRSVTPDQVAVGIVDGVQRRRAEVVVPGGLSSVAAAVQWAWPTLADRILDLSGMPAFWKRVADGVAVR